MGLRMGFGTGICFCIIVRVVVVRENSIQFTKLNVQSWNLGLTHIAFKKIIILYYNYKYINVLSKMSLSHNYVFATSFISESAIKSHEFKFAPVDTTGV